MAWHGTDDDRADLTRAAEPHKCWQQAERQVTHARSRSNGTHSFAASADGAVPFHSDGAQHLAFARLGHGARRRRQKPSAARAPADLISSHRPGGSSSAGSAGKAGWLPGKLAPVCISLRLVRSEQTTSACRRRQVRPGGCRSLRFKKPAADPSPCLRSGTRVCVFRWRRFSSQS